MFLQAIIDNGGPGGGATTWEDLGSTFEEGTVLAETTVVIDHESGAGGTPDVISLTVGNEYTVNWNGVPYKCVAADMSAFTPGSVALGDIGFAENGEPTEGGAPFIILGIPADMIEATGGAGISIVSLDGSESVTLSITGPVEIITPVPDKYLPDANTIFLYLVSFLNKVGNAEAAVCKSYTATSKADMYTKEELRRAFLSGRAIFAACDNAEVYAPCSFSFNVAGHDSAQVFVQQADTSARTAENFPDDTTPAIL